MHSWKLMEVDEGMWVKTAKVYGSQRDRLSRSELFAIGPVLEWELDSASGSLVVISML